MLTAVGWSRALPRGVFMHAEVLDQQGAESESSLLGKPPASRDPPWTSPVPARSGESVPPPLATTPIESAIHLRAPVRCESKSDGGGSEPSLTWDLARSPLIAWILRRPRLQPLLTLPIVILFVIVIVDGFIGTSDPTLNFGTTITWYVWFAMVFVLMVTLGRAWCVVCPFGGLAESVQRVGPNRRGQKGWGLNLKLPTVGD